MIRWLLLFTLISQTVWASDGLHCRVTAIDRTVEGYGEVKDVDCGESGKGFLYWDEEKQETRFVHESGTTGRLVASFKG